MSDRWERKRLNAVGMCVQAGRLFLSAATRDFRWRFVDGVLPGRGIAKAYPNPIASESDASHPSWWARSLSIYRFRRDLGYAIGALTFASGAVTAFSMTDLQRGASKGQRK